MEKLRLLVLSSKAHIDQSSMAWLAWQRDRDSNPGYPCRYNGFRIRPVRPLRHLSAHEVCLQVTCSYQTDSEMQRKKHRVCARVVAWLKLWPGDSSIGAQWGKISIPSGNLEDEKTRLSNNGLKSAPADANRVQQV